MRTRFFHSTLSVAIFAAFATPVLADTSTQSTEADTELEEIVVTASGFAQKAKEAAVESTHQRNTYVKRHYSSHF